LRLAARRDVIGLSEPGLRIVGPEIHALGLAGERVYPEAGAIAALAFTQRGVVPGEALEPIYLRPTAFVKVTPAPTTSTSLRSSASK
jgi:hypothetical protein